MNTISITDLHIRPTVGVHDFERIAPQDLYLDVSLTFERSKIADDLATTVDYVPVVNAIDLYIKTKQPYLIETVGEAVLDICFAQSGVTKASVTVKKPGALKNGLAAVTITRP